MSMQQLVRLQRQITKYIRQVKRYLNLIHRFQKRRGGSNGGNGQHPHRRRRRNPNPKQHNPKNHPVGTNHLVEPTEKEEIPVIIAQPQETETKEETKVVVIQEPPSKD